MTQAIDGLVNVDFADREMPDWMVRVKDDYFKGGFEFASPELEELLDDMDGHGVEKAILTTQVSLTAETSRAIRFVEARPDRFALGVGGFDLLKPMKTVRSLESFVANNPVVYASVGPSFWGDGMYPPTDAVYFPLYVKCCELELPLCMNAGIPGPPLPASGWLMSVMRAAVRVPALFPVATISSARWMASASCLRKAPEPVFTSSTNASSPAASFLLMMDAQIRNGLSTVAVRSRSE
jgi:predicted TIM-barrel fold metal-dependent hydrolase